MATLYCVIEIKCVCELPLDVCFHDTALLHHSVSTFPCLNINKAAALWWLPDAITATSEIIQE